MEQEEEGVWRQSLKAGDEVFVSEDYAPAREERVSRVTPTQIIVGGIRYRKTNGFSIGGSEWHQEFIMPPSEALREARSLWVLRRRASEIKAHITIPRDREGVESFISAVTPFLPSEKAKP